MNRFLKIMEKAAVFAGLLYKNISKNPAIISQDWVFLTDWKLLFSPSRQKEIHHFLSQPQLAESNLVKINWMLLCSSRTDFVYIELHPVLISHGLEVIKGISV